MDKYSMYIFLIFFIKFIFIILAVTHLYLKQKGEDNSKMDKNILFWKERVEFIFIILMSLLLIFLFYPRTNRIFMIDHETKVLLFLFGVILIITAKWNTFIKESDIFKDVQSSV